MEFVLTVQLVKILKCKLLLRRKRDRAASVIAAARSGIRIAVYFLLKVAYDSLFCEKIHDSLRYSGKVAYLPYGSRPDVAEKIYYLALLLCKSVSGALLPIR